MRQAPQSIVFRRPDFLKSRVELHQAALLLKIRPIRVSQDHSAEGVYCTFCVLSFVNLLGTSTSFERQAFLFFFNASSNEYSWWVNCALNCLLAPQARHSSHLYLSWHYCQCLYVFGRGWRLFALKSALEFCVTVASAHLQGYLHSCHCSLRTYSAQYFSSNSRQCGKQLFPRKLVPIQSKPSQAVQRHCSRVEHARSIHAGFQSSGEGVKPCACRLCT